jgi:biotin carboxyl carrier protein
MPGSILETKVKTGDSVNPGDVVCVLEAMKMKNMIHTNRAGVIASVDVIAGQDVDYGAVLVTFE